MDALPEALPAELRAATRDLLEGLRGLDGVVAVALGGSWARGTARSDSDVDLGLYYHDTGPFSLAALRSLIDRTSRSGGATVSDFYEWGPWVNGGAWIPTPGGRIDLLYRSLEQLQRVIHEARAGRWESHYGQQPTHGFHNVIYLAEIRDGVALHDPGGVLAALAVQILDYPAELRRTIVREGLWSAEFTLHWLEGFARRGDVYNAVGCMTRALAQLTQVLFALNRVYFPGDKGALETVDGFGSAPPGYRDKVVRLLARPGGDAAGLGKSARTLEGLFRSVAALAGEDYTPKYALPGPKGREGSV